LKRVSLKVIAEELSVSVATVSLVLSGKNERGRVSQEVEKKILNKAAELNYMPNSFAKGLKMGRSKTLGLIVADVSNVFFGTLALHIQEYAEKEGYAVIIANTNEQEEKMEKMIKLLTSRQVDGLIVTPTEKSEKLIERLIVDKMPFVLVDRSFPTINTNFVMINNYEISYQATQKLIERGCRNIGLLNYHQNMYHTNERKRGCIEALQQANIYHPENVKEVRYENLKKDVENGIKELVKNKIDGIFFTTNSISILGVKNLVKQNVDIRNSMKMVCFDENDAFYLLPFSVPFIKQPIEKMGQRAIQLLIDQIEKQNSTTEKYIVDAELIIK
jgi:LacI family transcriptional regulator